MTPETYVAGIDERRYLAIVSQVELRVKQNTRATSLIVMWSPRRRSHRVHRAIAGLEDNPSGGNLPGTGSTTTEWLFGTTNPGAVARSRPTCEHPFRSGARSPNAFDPLEHLAVDFRANCIITLIFPRAMTGDSLDLQGPQLSQGTQHDHRVTTRAGLLTQAHRQH